MTSPPTEPCLVLFDGLNLVRRVYEANPMPDSREKAEAARVSSLRSFLRGIRETEATHVLVAFDVGGQTWRHRLYPQYKSKRKPMPEHMKEMLPALTAELRDEGITCVSVPDVEAEDVLASVVARYLAARPEARITVVSTDKDLLHLSSKGPNVRIRHHFDSLYCDEQWVQRKFGVLPAQVPELLALTGDSTDGIPGIERVATKTAAKLLTEYGSLDAIVAAAPNMPGALGERVREGLPVLALSRQLVALQESVELVLSLKDLKYPRG